jgi:hypothetical protein
LTDLGAKDVTVPWYNLLKENYARNTQRASTGAFFVWSEGHDTQAQAHC